jgi:hypothetical protein
MSFPNNALCRCRGHGSFRTGKEDGILAQRVAMSTTPARGWWEPSGKVFRAKWPACAWEDDGNSAQAAEAEAARFGTGAVASSQRTETSFETPGSCMVTP